MERDEDKFNDINQTGDIQDDISEDELTDVELDPVSGGVLRPPSTVKPVYTQYIEMPPLFIQAKA